MTEQQKLAARKIKKPPYLIYQILGKIWRIMYIKKLGVNVTYQDDPRKEKGPYILVSNHASRLDYIFTAGVLLPHTYNFVAGYNEFFRSHLAGVFRLLQVIPKKNFVPDLHTITSVSRVLKSGGRVIIFPEGMSSISGSNQPCALGTGKFLKHFKVPVYMAKISGGYLTSTKYCLDERRGRVDITFSKLFTPDDLASLTPDDIQNKLNVVLHNDDYEWNKTARVKYKANGQIAKNLHTLLFRCPRCGTEFSMKGEGNKIFCTACGNGATMNEYYDLIPFDDTCVIPETPRVWFDMERAEVRKQVSAPDFSMTEKVKLGTLPTQGYLKNQKTSEIVGEGEIHLDKNGFSYRGTRDGKEFSFMIPPTRLPTFGMCTDVSRFYTFYNGEFLEFYPENETVEKWFMAVEENHRLAGGEWQDFAERS